MWTTPMYDTTKLTVELGTLVDNVDNPVDIWDFEYDSFYTGKEKEEFERKVIDHYYFRQIGQETVGRFKRMFAARVREIAPYYKKLYESVKIMDAIEDPFGNVDIIETFEEESTATNEGTTSTSSLDEAEGNSTKSESLEHRFSNTPQGSIDNIDNYLTEATKDTNQTTDNNESSVQSTGNITSQGESTATTKHTYTKKGNQGVNTYAHDMIEYRQAIINVDLMFINNLQDLFLGVY